MKFRSATENPVYVSSTTGVCAWVGPEWRELPACLHREALAMDGGKDKNGNIRGRILTDNMTDASIAEQGKSEPGRIDATEERLREVLIELSVRGAAEDFTRDDLPDLRKLSRKAGFSVNRDDMIRVWQQIRAQQTNKVA